MYALHDLDAVAPNVLYVTSVMSNLSLFVGMLDGKQLTRLSRELYIRVGH